MINVKGNGEGTVAGDEKRIDLHLHTTESDGSLSPSRLVRRAHARELAAIAVTDHDTVEGVEPALEAARGLPLEVVPGIEINTDYGGEEVHILGYYIDHRNPDLLAFLQDMRSARRERAAKIVERLRELGIELELDQVTGRAEDVVGRAHIAQAMVENGMVQNWDQAFSEYIGYNGPAYVPRPLITPERVCGVIRSACGIPVLAHPGMIGNRDLVREIIEQGVMGLEVYHSRHGLRDEQIFREMARREGLLITGGSDCHGPRMMNGCSLLGTLDIPHSLLQELKKARESICSGE